MAIARSMSPPRDRRLSIASFRASVTKPLRPRDPSSVQTWSSLDAAPSRSSKTRRSARRAPRIVTTSCPASRKARAMGSIGAAPMPPATHATVPRKSSGLPGTPMCVGLPRGPATLAKESPSANASVISIVVLPTAWTTSVIVPARRSTSAIVSGIRSDRAWGRTMTNWPGAVAAGHARRFDLEEADVFPQGSLDQDSEHRATSPSADRNGLAEDRAVELFQPMVVEGVPAPAEVLLACFDVACEGGAGNLLAPQQVEVDQLLELRA